jgi:DNA gyrase subunit A
MGSIEPSPDVRDGLVDVEREVLELVGVNPGLRSAAELFNWPARTPDEWSSDGIPDLRYETAAQFTHQPRSRYPLLRGDGNLGAHGEPLASAWSTEIAATQAGIALRRGTFPNLLANGSQRGLTRLLPHNLRELAVAIEARMDDPDLDVDGLLLALPGPDLPGGGVITDDGQIADAYRLGRGEVHVSGVAVFEPSDYDRAGVSIVIIALPYLVAAGGDDGLVMEMVTEMQDGGLPDIEAIRDQSDRRGMRIVVDLREGVDGERALAQLRTYTRLDTTLEIRSLVTIDGEPRTLPMLGLIDRYIDDQRSRRRATTRDSDHEIDAAIRRDLRRLAAEIGDARRTEIVAPPS